MAGFCKRLKSWSCIKCNSEKGRHHRHHYMLIRKAPEGVRLLEPPECCDTPEAVKSNKRR